MTHIRFNSVASLVRLAFLAPALLLPVAANSPAADLTLKQKVMTRSLTQDGEWETTEGKQTVYLRGSRGSFDRARVRRAPDDVILLADKRILWQLDHMLRTYEEQSLEELGIRWEKLNQEILSAIKDMPEGARRSEMILSLTDSERKWDFIWDTKDPEERRKLAARCNILPERPVREIRSTGETREILGHTCRKYEFLQNGTLLHVAWITTDYTLASELYDWIGITGILDTDLAKQAKSVKGLPLETHMCIGCTREERIETVEISEEPLDRRTFSIPRGYRKPVRK